MILLELFFVFFVLSLLGFGGGYAIIPLIQSEAINRNWLTLYEFADITAITQISPGPLGANAAGYVGHAVAGPLGAIAAIIGAVTPSFILIFAVIFVFKKFYEKPLTQSVLSTVRPTAIGLIASAAFTFFMMSPLDTARNITVTAVIFAAALILSFVKKINPILIILLSALLGVILL